LTEKFKVFNFKAYVIKCIRKEDFIKILISLMPGEMDARIPGQKHGKV